MIIPWRTFPGVDLDLQTLINEPRGYRRNILVVADGYYRTAKRLFLEHCDDIARTLINEPWWTEAGGQDYVSLTSCYVDSSQVPTRTQLQVLPGWLPGPEVAFGGKFQSQPPVHLLSGNYDPLNKLLAEVITSLFPNVEFFAVVLVNYDQVGGGEGNIAIWCTNSGEHFTKLVLHELGHVIFALSDEYAGAHGTVSSWSTSLREFNTCSTVGNPTWKPQLTLGVPPPSQASPAGCAQVVESLVSPTEVGAFEGAYSYNCGVYRPSARCRMRDYRDDFCPVCRRAIVEELQNVDSANSLFVM